MSQYAFITPTYPPDLERCELLCRSMDELVDSNFKHYLLIDRKNVPYFQHVASSHRIIIESESIMPWWLFRLPFFSKGWMSLKSLPVRNWIFQQLLKLRVAEVVQERILCYMDSDACFVRPFRFEQFERDGLVRLFCMPGKGNIESHYPWHQTAARLLGLRPNNYFGGRYIGNLISWRRDNVLKMFERIENITDTPWLEAVSRSWHLSEYVLYGVFSDFVLGEQSGHYHDPVNYCLDYWEEHPMTKDQKAAFIASFRPEQFMLMVSAKSKIPIDEVNEIRNLLRGV